MTFFSGTDTSTLQKEGTDRNNFVSLIVNNAGSYTAAITRKVDYTENHDIKISGKYPFFGTRQFLEIPESTTTEEKTKTVIEWFDLKIEKETSHDVMDEYEERFNEVKSKITKPSTSYYPPRGGYGGYWNYGNGFYTGYGNDYDSDEESFYNKPFTSSEKNLQEKPVKKEESSDSEAKDESIYDALLLYDNKLLSLALQTPVLTSVFNELFLQIITGCPIISKWVTPSVTTQITINDILGDFAKDAQYDYKEYSSFVFDNLSRTFALMDPEDYFPRHVVDNEVYSIYRFEDILLIKMLEFAHTLEQNYLREAIEEAIKEFYNIT